MEYLKTKEFYSVVLLGNFNPSMFHPSWLKERNIIGDEDYNITDQVLVSDELTNFKVGDWLAITIQKQRAEFKILDSDKVVLMIDVITGCLGAMPITPITALGINKGYLLSLKDENDYYKLGKSLTPLSLWESEFNDPKLKKIVIENINGEHFNGKSQTVIIQPADASCDKENTIDININNHFEYPEKNCSTSLVISTLTEEHNNCFNKLDKVTTCLFSQI